MALKRAVWDKLLRSASEEPLLLATETVKSAALAFEGIDDIHSGDGLSFCWKIVKYNIRLKCMEKFETDHARSKSQRPGSHFQEKLSARLEFPHK